MYKEVLIQQDTPKWHEWRKTKIGASDTAKIMNESVFGSPLSVYNEKVLDVRPFLSNAMKKGKEKEEEIRNFLSSLLNISLQPKCFESTEFPFMGVSLDAISDDNSIMAELKHPSFKTMEKVLEGNYCKDYEWQCQKHMFMMDKKETILFFYINPYIYRLFRIQRNEEMIEKMKKEESRFWNENILKKVPPTDPNYCEPVYDGQSNKEALELKEILEEKERLEKREKELKEILIKKHGKENCIFPLPKLKLLHIEKNGTVNWKSVCKKWTISEKDLEEFKSSSIHYNRFIILK